jgi:uncharacterized protein with HEPN domain
MHRNDFIRLRHILDAAKEAVSFVQGKTKRDLFKDRILALALIKSVEIMGEAAANVSRGTQQLLPQLPWPDLIKMRNRLIHGYFDINFEIVWDTVSEDLPPLDSVVTRL